MAMIYRVKELDINNTAISSEETYYICTDTKRLYCDLNGSRSNLSCLIINTEVDRLHHTVGANGQLYYVWETNTLWVFNGGWIQKAGIVYNTNGYYYTDTGNLNSVEDNDNGNGLLGDGSVVVRDINKIIKGKIKINGITNKLEISSILGGGITFYPSSTSSSAGVLDITSSSNMIYNGDIYVKNNNKIEKLVTASELNNVSVNSCVSLTNNAITHLHINNNAVLSRHINNNTILAKHISNNAINNAHINNNAIINRHIASSAVQSRHINSNNVLERHINNNAIISRHINNNAIESRHINNGIIESRHIIDGAINTNHIVDKSITNTKIKELSITQNELAYGSVTGEKLQAKTVTSEKATFIVHNPNNFFSIDYVTQGFTLNNEGLITVNDNCFVTDYLESSVYLDSSQNFNLYIYIRNDITTTGDSVIIAGYDDNHSFKSLYTYEYVNNGYRSYNMQCAKVTVNDCEYMQCRATLMGCKYFRVSTPIKQYNYIMFRCTTTLEYYEPSFTFANSIKITGDTILNNSIKSSHIQDNAITSNHIQDNSIMQNMLTHNILNSAHIQSKSISAEKVNFINHNPNNFFDADYIIKYKQLNNTDGVTENSSYFITDYLDVDTYIRNYANTGFLYIYVNRLIMSDTDVVTINLYDSANKFVKSCQIKKNSYSGISSVDINYINNNYGYYGISLSNFRYFRVSAPNTQIDYLMFSGNKTINGYDKAYKILSNNIKISNDNMQNDAIASNHIQNNVISSSHIQNNTITSNHIQNNTVTSNHIQNNAVTSSHIQNSAITSNHIQNNSITQSMLTYNILNSVHIQSKSITAEKIDFINHNPNNFFDADYIVKNKRMYSTDSVVDNTSYFITDYLDIDAYIRKYVNTNNLFVYVNEDVMSNTDVITINLYDENNVFVKSCYIMKNSYEGISYVHVDFSQYGITINNCRYFRVSAPNNQIDYLMFSDGSRHVYKYDKAYKILSNSIKLTSDHIQDNMIISSHIQSNSITSSHVQSNSIVSYHIQNNVITGNHIQSNSITTNHLQSNIISSSHVQSNSIVSYHIQNNVITGNHIQSNSIISSHIQSNSIVSYHIQNNVITGSHIKNNVITSEHIQNNTITSNHIKNNVITSSHVQSNSIVSYHIQNNVITSSHIKNNSIDSRHIKESVILSNHIQNNVITGNHIQSNTITSIHVQSNSIVSYHIQNNTITSSHIKNGAINKQHLSADVIKYIIDAVKNGIDGDDIV